MDLLESAVFRPQASFGGKDLYPTVFDKAASLFYGILFNHPFVDGNKRSALGCTAAFLAKNDYHFTATIEEMVAFPLAVEKMRPDQAEIAQWLKEHTKRRKKR